MSSSLSFPSGQVTEFKSHASPGFEQQLTATPWLSRGREAREGAMFVRGASLCLDECCGFFSSDFLQTYFSNTFSVQQCLLTLFLAVSSKFFSIRWDAVLRICAKLNAESKLGKSFYRVWNTNSTTGD